MITVVGSNPSQVTRESKTHHTVGFLFGEKPSLLEIFDSIKNSNRRLYWFYFLTLGPLGQASTTSQPQWLKYTPSVANFLIHLGPAGSGE